MAMAYLNFQSLLMAMLPLFLSLVAADCNSFTAAGDYFTRAASGTQIISKGFVCDTPNSDYGYPRQQRCNASSECPTYSYGVVNSVGTNNLSLTEDQVLPLYNLVLASTTYKPVAFLYSLSSYPGNVSSCLHAKRANETSAPAGYWAFTPILLCVRGTLSQCTNGPVTDGTPIEICGVDTFGQTAETVDVNGVINFVSTDAETVANLTSNPAATVTAVARLPSSTAIATSGSSAAAASPTSGGAERVIVGGLLSGLTLGALFVL